MVKDHHPDKSKTDADLEKRTQRMARINDAYQKRDLAELQRLEEEFASDPDAVDGDDVGANLIRAIRHIAQVKKKIEAIDAETEALKERIQAQMPDRVNLNIFKMNFMPALYLIFCIIE